MHPSITISFRLKHHWGGRVLLFVACCLLLAACVFPGSVKPTVKIGLSAPFEGLHRDLGYEVLHAVRLAVRQRNEAGGVGDRYLVEFVALNDFNEGPEAIRQARKMVVDPGVMGVLGGWAPEVAQVVVPEYDRLGLAFLAPEADFTGSQPSLSVKSAFVADYLALSGGAPPSPAAVWAYETTGRLLDALDTTVRVEGQPTRAAVLAVLAAGH